MRTETITVPEISCGHCRSSIEGALHPLDGVAEASVDVDARTVTVTYDETTIRREQLISTIEDQGYDVPV
ncbi:MAG: cation transporter [Actinomycetota bacterium]|nr:cation transporter [Actinomycetota bacterium]